MDSMESGFTGVHIGDVNVDDDGSEEPVDRMWDYTGYGGILEHKDNERHLQHKDKERHMMHKEWRKQQMRFII